MFLSFRLLIYNKDIKFSKLKMIELHIIIFNNVKKFIKYYQAVNMINLEHIYSLFKTCFLSR